MPAIFFIETPSDGIDHGIGSYAKNILPELVKSDRLVIYHVRISFQETGSVIRRQISSNHFEIEITFQIEDAHPRGEITIPTFIARSVLCILSSFLLKSQSVIFHLNSTLQHSFAIIAREYDFKVVFTHHISIWRVLYNNNEKTFCTDWENMNNSIKNGKVMRSIHAEQKMMEVADSVICLTQDSRDFTIKYFKIPAEKINIIPNGLLKDKRLPMHPDKKTLKRTMGFLEDDFIFLFVGRLIPQKGLTTLIEAFKQTAARLNNVRLIVVGRGNIDNYLLQTSDICGKISFTGYIDSSRLDKFYQIADVGVMPSRTEQSSFVVLEMLSYKIPVISSDIYAFSYPFQHRENILKVKTNETGFVDLQNLADSLHLLYDDSELREKISIKGHELFINHFQSNIMAEKTSQVYEVLSGT